MTAPYLSIVIPAYNEEERISATLDEVVAYLSHQSYSWEVLVVDDGSTDRTTEFVDSWAGEVAGVSLESVEHGGKGWAVKQGMLSATGEYRFMCDADLSMPIEQLSRFLDRMEEGYDVVIGSREAVGARRYDEPPLRHLMGRVFNWTVRMLAVRGFQDTQCGFKCFRGEVVQELFSKQKARGFSFDVEILYLALRRNMRIVEIPIDWYHQEASKVRPLADSFLMLRDTLTLRLVGSKRYRDRP